MGEEFYSQNIQWSITGSIWYHIKFSKDYYVIIIFSLTQVIVIKYFTYEKDDKIKFLAHSVQ